MKHIISFFLRKVPRKYLQLFSHFVAKILAFFYAGNTVECPVCKNAFRKFLPYGRLEPRQNALCPSCLTLERHRLMWLFLKNKTNFFTDRLKVLHVAPELCFIDRFESLSNLDYITGDIESPLAKVKMDLHDIPFEDNTFDVTFCNHVMEHVEDDIHCMRELHRILKPGGWAIIQSPMDLSLSETYEDNTITNPSEREKAFGQNDHLRMFGRDYKNRLIKGGFDVTEEDYAHEIEETLRKRYALPEDEIIYFCRKL